MNINYSLIFNYILKYILIFLVNYDLQHPIMKLYSIFDLLSNISISLFHYYIRFIIFCYYYDLFAFFIHIYLPTFIIIFSYLIKFTCFFFLYNIYLHIILYIISVIYILFYELFY